MWCVKLIHVEVTPYGGSDVRVGFPKLLPQGFGQGRHRVLGGRVEMDVRTVYNPMSTYAATEDVQEA